MDSHAARGIYADEHLRRASAGQPNLDIDKRAVIECFVMNPVMYVWVRPLPKSLPANPHVVLLRLQLYAFIHHSQTEVARNRTWLICDPNQTIGKYRFF
nr:hypothetical protein [Pseudomonas putida]